MQKLKSDFDQRNFMYDVGDCVNHSLIVDVGANIGAFCIAASRLYPQAQIICAEPSPETYFLLQWNLAENHVPLAELSSLGLKNKPGVIAM